MATLQDSGTQTAGLLSMSEACKFAGIHANTLRKYANLGQIPVYRILGGQRRFKRDDLAEFFGLINIEKNINDGATLLAYARVSGINQAKGMSKGLDNSLSRQIERIENYCLEMYGQTPLMFSEVGSSLNFKRKKLTELLRGILSGKYDGASLILEYKDRGFRFGFELLETICQVHNIKISIIEKNQDATETQELSEDLLAIIGLFHNKSMGARAAKVLIKNIDDKTLARIRELRAQGTAVACPRVGNQSLS